MSRLGWFVLDGRRILAGPFGEPPPLDIAKSWLHQDLRDLGRRTVVTDEEIRRRLLAVRVARGVRASRGGFREIPPRAA